MSSLSNIINEVKTNTQYQSYDQQETSYSLIPTTISPLSLSQQMTNPQLGDRSFSKALGQHQDVKMSVSLAGQVTVQITSPLEKIRAMACESRAPHAQEVIKRFLYNEFHGVTPEIETGKIIWQSVEDFTTNNNLESSIIHFMEKSTGVKVDNLSCVEPKRINKKEAVFLSKDYAVKVYPKGGEFFGKSAIEISGQEIIRKIKLTEGRTTEFIAAGTCEINSVKSFMLLMPREPGKPIKDYLDDIFIASDRHAATETCKAALKQLGRLMGEIHSTTAMTRSGDSQAVKEATTDRLRGLLQRYLDRYKANGGDDLEHITKYFEDLLSRYDSKIFHFTVTHGETSLGNYLYDNEAGVTLIDTPRIHFSINGNGDPLFASHVHDVARTDDDIAKWVLHQEYNSELIDQLQEAFHEGYRQTGKKVINASQLFYDKAWTMLTRLESVIQNRSEDSPKGRIYTYYADFFKRKPLETF